VLDSLGSRGDQPAWGNKGEIRWRAADSCAAGDAEHTVLNAGETKLFAAPPFGGRTKRGLDLFLALLLLPIAAIVALPVAVLIALEGGKPIYGHLRVGWNGRLFRCYKFRTMVTDADVALRTLLQQDPEARLQWLERHKLENDPRVTRLGWLLRETNLDEIPQIWNVLRGEMSWVGPRPVVKEELSRYGAHLPAYLACRPGITGLWQVSRRSDTPYSKRVTLDQDYARNWSVARDLTILFRTIPRILSLNGRP
jgi:lipopolysaccharide/colanic/teichoic acid biosynthesis glycosyltransferase